VTPPDPPVKQKFWTRFSTSAWAAPCAERTDRTVVNCAITTGFTPVNPSPITILQTLPVLRAPPQSPLRCWWRVWNIGCCRRWVQSWRCDSGCVAMLDMCRMLHCVVVNPKARSAKRSHLCSANVWLDDRCPLPHNDPRYNRSPSRVGEKTMMARVLTFQFQKVSDVPFAFVIRLALWTFHCISCCSFTAQNTKYKWWGRPRETPPDDMIAVPILDSISKTVPYRRRRASDMCPLHDPVAGRCEWSCGLPVPEFPDRTRTQFYVMRRWHASRVTGAGKPGQTGKLEANCE